MSTHISTPRGAIKTKWDFSNFPTSNSIYENVNKRERDKGLFHNISFYSMSYAFNTYCILLMVDGGDQLGNLWECIGV